MATKIMNKQPAEPIIPTNKELRFTAELRAADDNDFCLEGYAALFNSESNDLGGFREKIAPAAFDKALGSGRDVKCLFNHDANHVLGRTKSGTLALSTDNRGLKFRCQLDPDNASHRNLYATVKRGDVDECSFAFTVQPDDQEWQQIGEGDDAYILRTLKSVDLYDVSAVTYPAYPGTQVGAREANLTAEVRSQLDAFKRSLADLAQNHQAQADAHAAIAADHGSQAADHKKAAELLEQESARMEKCSATYGDCNVDECECQNRMVDRSNVYEPDYGDDELEQLLDEDDRSALEDDDDLSDVENTGNNDDGDAARKVQGEAEQRSAGKQVRTKKVGDNFVSKRHFAHVADRDKTQTYRLAIHTAEHVSRSAQGLDQIPEADRPAAARKVRAAAKRFGVNVAPGTRNAMTPKEIADALFKARALCK